MNNNNKLKIHIYGNVLNNGYYLGQVFIKLGYEVTLFLDRESPFSQDYPWWEDPSLSETNLPSWIKYYNFKPNFFFTGSRERKLYKDFAQADVALVCSYGPIVAGKAGIPFVFYSYGEDLNIADTKRGLYRVLNQLIRFRRPSGIIKYLTIGIVQRYYLKKAKFVGIAMGYQIPYLRAIGVFHNYKKIRLVLNLDNYKFKKSAELENKYKSYQRVFFMISRHVWSSLWREAVKGNDKFIRAFASYVREERPNVKLILIEKGVDVNKTKELIEELGISEYVDWVKEMNKDGIKAFLALNNLVVVDQFWHDSWYKLYPEDLNIPLVRQFIASGKNELLSLIRDEQLSIVTFGAASIEAMVAKRPLITVFTDFDFYDRELPPHFNAFTEYEIFNVLKKIHKMTDSQLEEVGQQEYDFIYKFHRYDVSINLYLDLLYKAIQKN